MPAKAATIQPVAVREPEPRRARPAPGRPAARARRPPKTTAARRRAVAGRWRAAARARDMSFGDFGSSIDQRASLGSRPVVERPAAGTTLRVGRRDGTSAPRRRRVGDCRDSSAEAASARQQGHGDERRGQRHDEFRRAWMSWPHRALSALLSTRCSTIFRMISVPTTCSTTATTIIWIAERIVEHAAEVVRVDDARERQRERGRQPGQDPARHPAVRALDPHLPLHLEPVANDRREVVEHLRRGCRRPRAASARPSRRTWPSSSGTRSAEVPQGLGQRHAEVLPVVQQPELRRRSAPASRRRPCRGRS